MAKFIDKPSHTFNEYLLIPGYSSSKCIPSNVSLKTPLVKYKKGKDDTFEYENFDKVKILSSLLSLNIEDDSENSSQNQFLNAFLSSIKQNENE